MGLDFRKLVPDPTSRNLPPGWPFTASVQAAQRIGGNAQDFRGGSLRDDTVEPAIRDPHFAGFSSPNHAQEDAPAGRNVVRKMSFRF